jgi:hypothetical protein
MVDTTKIIEKLHALKDLGNEEQAHIRADALLCQLLRDLGYADVVEAYEQIDKWYA